MKWKACCNDSTYPTSLDRFFSYYDIGGTGWRESLVIGRCRPCKRWWKIRYQWDAGTGKDIVAIPLGGKARRWTFTRTELASVKRLVREKTQAELVKEG